MNRMLRSQKINFSADIALPAPITGTWAQGEIKLLARVCAGLRKAPAFPHPSL
jgi:hypothetical protein